MLYDMSKDYIALAIEKLEQESKSFKGDRKAEVVKPYAVNTIKEFCEKSEDFAKVFYATRRTLTDCLKEILKSCNNAISDIEVYRRIANFYFPNSDVKFVMILTVAEKYPDDEYIIQEEVEEKPTKASKKEEATENPFTEPEEEEAEQEEPKPKKKVKPKVEEAEPKMIQISLFD